MTDISQLHQQWLQDPKYKAEYDALASEFDLAAAIIAARSSANLTQEQLAQLMNAKQSLVARLESGQHNATVKTLLKVAQATNTRLHISFLPSPSSID